MRKQRFYYILRRAAPKNKCIFCLDKYFSCYIVVEMVVTPGVFFRVSTWKFIHQDFYSQFPMSLVRGLEYPILAQIQSFNPQKDAVILNAWRCWLFCISVCFLCRMVAATWVLVPLRHRIVQSVQRHVLWFISEQIWFLIELFTW